MDIVEQPDASVDDVITRLRQQIKELQEELACYQPDENWKSAYLEQVELNTKTLNELRGVKELLRESQNNDLYAMRLLAESQAREAKLRDILSFVMDTHFWTGNDGELARKEASHYLDLPQDDTAMKEMLLQAKREALNHYLEVIRNVFEEYGMQWPLFEQLTSELRRMAEETK